MNENALPLLLDGRLASQHVQATIMQEMQKNHLTRAPGIAFVLVGDNPASQSYIRNKKKRCHEAGFLSFDQELTSHISQADLLQVIDSLNHDPRIDGILVQLPLPSHFDTLAILERIDPLKDIDGFHPVNMGKLLLGQSGGFWPCTPYGIIELFRYYKISLENKHVVILGRGNVVGKPLAALCVQKQPGLNATVTIAHSKTPNLTSLCQTADILVSAVGHPGLIRKNMIKLGAVIIDVGTSRTSDGKITGDVVFEEVKALASAITPMPGGVGPMTIAMLLKNAWESYKRRLI